MPPLSQNLNRFDSADILESMKKNIFQAWELECRQMVPAAKSQNRPDFINAIPKFLDELVAILRTPNQQLKNEKASEIACAHGEERAVLNEYTLDQVIFEYQILRVILIEALETKGQVDIDGRKTIHEFMDQSIRKAASRYTDIELNRATALILENTKFKQEAEYEREKISEIFAQSPGALAVLEGPDHMFTRVNEAYLSLLFGNRKDLVGKSVKDAVPEAVQQGFIALLDCVYNTGVPYVGTETPIKLLQIDGTLKKFYLNFVYQPLRGNSGNIVGVVAAITDMTNQVESRKLVQDSAKALKAAQDQLVYNLETSRLQLYDFFMQAPLPMVIMEGPQHKFVIANPHYEKFVGRSVVGKTLADAFSVEEAALFVPIVDNVYKTGISFSGTAMPVNLTNNVGETVAHWMDIGFHPFRGSDGSIKGVFAILQDLTEHVQSKKKLVDQTDALKKSKNQKK